VDATDVVVAEDGVDDVVVELPARVVVVDVAPLAPPASVVVVEVAPPEGGGRA
jgi:hypothetical protein